MAPQRKREQLLNGGFDSVEEKKNGQTSATVYMELVGKKIQKDKPQLLMVGTSREGRGSWGERMEEILWQIPELPIGRL